MYREFLANVYMGQGLTICMGHRWIHHKDGLGFIFNVVTPMTSLNRNRITYTNALNVELIAAQEDHPT